MPHSEDVLRSAREALESKIEREDYTVLEEVRHHQNGVTSEFDVLAVDGLWAEGFEVKNKPHGKAFTQLNKASDFLENNGFEVDYDFLVMHESMATLNDALEELPPIFTSESLSEVWEHDDHLPAYRISGILQEIEFNNAREPKPIPKYDWSLLDSLGLVKEEDGMYSPTAELYSLVNSGTQDHVLHRSPRYDRTFHVSEF